MADGADIFMFDTNTGARVRFLHGAFKHGVSALDQIHVMETCPFIARLPPSGGRARAEWLFVGWDRRGRELEVIALLGRDEHFLVIHAMPMRSKWARMRDLARNWETP